MLYCFSEICLALWNSLSGRRSRAGCFYIHCKIVRCTIVFNKANTLLDFWPKWIWSIFFVNVTRHFPKVFLSRWDGQFYSLCQTWLSFIFHGFRVIKKFSIQVTSSTDRTELLNKAHLQVNCVKKNRKIIARVPAIIVSFLTVNGWELISFGFLKFF